MSRFLPAQERRIKAGFGDEVGARLAGAIDSSRGIGMGRGVGVYSAVSGVNLGLGIGESGE